MITSELSSSKKYLLVMVGLVFMILGASSSVFLVSAAEPIDYLIITSAEFEDYWQPLVEWKTRKGIKTGVITLARIYEDCVHAGLGNLEPHEMIRECIALHQQFLGVKYVLLGGDDTIIVPWPAGEGTGGATGGGTPPPGGPGGTSGGNGGTEAPSDTKYGDVNNLTGVYKYEVYVGRAPVRNQGDIELFINKTLKYEQDPPLSDWVRTAAFFGFDVLIVPGEPSGESYTINYIQPLFDQQLDPWVIETEYDSSTQFTSDPNGSHKGDVIEILGQSRHLLSHIDHGKPDGMRMGFILDTDEMSPTYNEYINETLESEEIKNIQLVYDELCHGIFYVDGCSTCRFDEVVLCPGEAFMQNPDGVVAYIGNTGMVSFPGDSSEVHETAFHLDKVFFDCLLNGNYSSLGEIFVKHKEIGVPALASYAKSDSWSSCVLFGDPSLQVWTDDPTELLVTYPSHFQALQTNNFSISVESSTNPSEILESVTVCLWKENEVYEVFYGIDISSADLIDFSVAPATTGEMKVTVTGKNLIPHTGFIVVQ